MFKIEASNTCFIVCMSINISLLIWWANVRFVQAMLSLQWREWMTKGMLEDYMSDRTFYAIHSSQLVDNPDQRLSSDINQFTSSTLSLAFTFLASIVDLISFSGILFTIYPPLFLALIVYAGGGTAVSFLVGKVCHHCSSTHYKCTFVIRIV